MKAAFVVSFITEMSFVRCHVVSSCLIIDARVASLTGLKVSGCVPLLKRVSHGVVFLTDHAFEQW